MLSHKSSLWHSLFVLLLVRTVFAQNWPCFEPDLSPVTSYDYLPCPNQANLPSMCCATNRTSFPDSCQDNGLCQSLVPNSAGTDIINQNIWRESCSDPTWHSPFCLKLCINGTGKVLGFHMVYSAVAQCLTNAGRNRTWWGRK